MRTPRDVVPVLAQPRAWVVERVVAEEGAAAQLEPAVAQLRANQVWFARSNYHWSCIAEHARH
jgi:hypothetical protein